MNALALLSTPAAEEVCRGPSEAARTLDVEGLWVRSEKERAAISAVRDVSFSLARSEMLAIVGESGSGKSVLLQALLGFSRGRPGIVAGSIRYHLADGRRLEPLRGFERDAGPRGPSRGSASTIERRCRTLRGRAVGLVLQNGRAALNPFLTIGTQLREALARRRPNLSRDEAAHAMEDVLLSLNFRQPSKVLAVYPHALSGGMAQRAMFAMAVVGDPEILFLDEVTTGLDVTLQAEMLLLVRKYREERGTTGILVTHHLGHAEQVADRVIVMRRGRIMQDLTTEELSSPDTELEEYTSKLVHAIREEGRAPSEEEFAPRPKTPRLILKIDDVGRTFRVRKSAFDRSPARIDAVSGVDLEIYRGETIAIVGESGSGKTTLARMMVGLEQPTSGRILFEGRDLLEASSTERKALQRRLQILFQNPYTSLNPAVTAVDAVAEALVVHRDLGWREAGEKALTLLDSLGVGRRARQPLGTLSGGERRRIGLLRAMESGATFTVLDEPSTGLDAIHRLHVSDILRQHRAQDPERTFVIISHDLGFVRRVADRVAVMYRGRLVELVDAKDLSLAARHHPYTELLLESATFLSSGDGKKPGPTRLFVRRDETRVGCGFRGRCSSYETDAPFAKACEVETPHLLPLHETHWVACHWRLNLERIERS
ncbi:MAG: ABC transporter ATP-binding protein [Myxococcales bacterium]|nr:ABC transporter ATP-binding protein [Myxococcales bacterium]